MYRLGLYEKAMPSGMTFYEMLSHTGKAGFDFMEISIDETDARLARLDWTEAEFNDFRAAVRETGVPVSSMCLSGHRKYPFGSHDPQKREKSMEIMQKAVLFAEKTGIRLIQLAGYDVYYEEGDADTVRWFGENLASAVEFAAMHSVTLGFETMETSFMDNVSKSMKYVEDINNPYLGVYPDLGNLTNSCRLYGTEVNEEIECGRGHLFAMHIKETEEGKYRDMEFGTGKVDFVSGISKAYKVGVRQYVAECWHNGCEEWDKRLAGINKFVRTAFDQAGISRN